MGRRRLPHRWGTVSALAAAGVALAATPALGATAAPVGSTALTTVAGAAPVLLKGATDTGAAPSRTEHMTLALALRNQAGLDALLAQPGHAALTPAQFTSRYAPAPATVTAVTSWAKSHGLAVTSVSPNRTLVSLSAPTGTLGRALGTSIHTFRAGTTTYRSVASTVRLPSSFASQVVGITGLSDLGKLRTVTRTAGARPQAAGATPQTFGPKELASFYDAPAGATGSGQKVTVIAEGDLTQVVTDLRTFESRFGLPTVPVTKVGPGSSDTAGQDEYDLDTQYSTGEAPGVSGLTIYDGKSLSNDDILSIINKWVTDDATKQASFSAGECEVLAAVTGLTTGLDQSLKQAEAQGQSLFVSSGDNGAFCSAVVGVNGIPAGAPSVDYPASSPHVVAVGGTTVTGTPALGGLYTGEVAWYGGGGGVSYVEPKPAYQTAAPVPARRGVPDVALDADPLTGYTVIVSGTAETIGGTSASAPAWQGYWARAQGAHNGSLGFAPRRLYAAKGGFHDIVVGTNGLFAAAPGYDYTTGLGTPDLKVLIPKL